jgi:alpha-tubulin suppressor-like RCC1 family protein
MSSHIAISTEIGQVYVAGSNSAGQLCLGTFTQSNSFSLAKIDASTNLSGILQSSVGSAHSIFLRSTGSVYTCGLNTNGQLGLGTTTDTSFSNIVLSSDTSILGNVVAVAAGASHSLFLLTDGSALACGANTSSQLGDGTTTDRSYPVNVLKSAGTLLDPVISLAGGTSHSVFATSAGTAWACGLNTNNQLGDGTTTTRAYATQVMTDASAFLTDVTQVSAGDLHCLALTSTGTVFGWGRNNSGQLSLGTTTDSQYATQCLYSAGINMDGIVAIASHSNHSLFLTTSGTVYSCGLNGNGQLGDGTLETRLYPVAVLTATDIPLTDVISIATAGNLSYFVRGDGSIFACGAGSGGGLGNGGVTDLSFATQVLSSDLGSAKSFGYSAAYWRNRGVAAASLTTGGFSAYDLANAGYSKTDLSNAGVTIGNIQGAGPQKLYSLGFSHSEIVNGTNTPLNKIGQITMGISKMGSLMSGGLLDAPKSISATGRDPSSISVAIVSPTFSTGLTGYSVQAVPVTGGSTVSKSLGVAGTLVDGLATGKIYDLSVRSVSSVGSSAATILRNSTALSVPATISAGSITTSGMTITFASALSSTQDCSYVLRTSPASNQYVLAANSTSQAISGLTESTAYEIILDASNLYTTNFVNTNATTLTPQIYTVSGTYTTGAGYLVDLAYTQTTNATSTNTYMYLNTKLTAMKSTTSCYLYIRFQIPYMNATYTNGYIWSAHPINGGNLGAPSRIYVNIGSLTTLSWGWRYNGTHYWTGDNSTTFLNSQSFSGTKIYDLFIIGQGSNDRIYLFEKQQYSTPLISIINAPNAIRNTSASTGTLEYIFLGMDNYASPLLSSRRIKIYKLEFTSSTNATILTDTQIENKVNSA